ncbi:MAG: tetratricopeptide repeat protein [Kiritimatiellaeota bacterium]|nr:tetratricopeptide repeat protein [Kiritimatiellota bacterium]
MMECIRQIFLPRVRSVSETVAARVRAAHAGRRAFLCLGLAAWGALARLDVQIRPNPLMVGETARFVITSDKAIPKLERLPRLPNVQWLGGPRTGQSIEIKNFRRSFTGTAEYLFRATAPGKLVFPPMPVTVKGQRSMTPRVTCEVKQAKVQTPGSRQVRLGDLAFVQVRLGPGPSPPDRIYVGQEVRLEIRVYAYERLFQDLSYPNIEIENASFRDYSAQNRQNSKFLVPRQQREIRNGLPFTVIPFVCRITPLCEGKLTGSGSVQVRLVAPRQRSSRRRADPLDPFSLFDDPFFPFGRNRLIPRTLTFKIPAVSVAPLPPVPKAAGVFLGLVGDWRLALRTDAASVRVGEPLTLELRIGGTGGLDALTPPKLDMPGFRTHEPEVKKETTGATSSATLTWALVPLEPDAVLAPLVFSTFNPEKGEYEPCRFVLPLKVKPAPVAAAPQGVVADSGRPTPKSTQSTPERHAATDIFYIKTKLGPYVRRPLWRNTAAPSLALVLLGALFYFGCLGLAVHRERLSGSETYRRRREALAKRSRLLRELRNCADGRCEAVICEQLVPYLSALCGLPPGTTPGALAEHLRSRDPTAADMLIQAEQGSFMPDAAARIDPRELIRRLKRLGFFLFAAGLFVVGPVPEARAGKPDKSAAGASIQDATRAYEEGHVTQAEVIYRRLRRTGAPNPALLYNLGNCAYRLGRLGEAAAFYEQARRLAPRDSQIIENLNFVRSRLGLPPVRQVRNPAELLAYMRDDLRPDEWGLLAAILAFLGCVWAGTQRLRRRPATAGVAAACVGVLVCALAVWSQLQTTYRPEAHGVVLSTRAAPHLLPNADSDKAKFALKPGEAVRIMEERTHWYRVRVRESEAWVEKIYVRRVW